MSSADIILSQLGGGNRLRAMIGVKNFAKGTDKKGNEYLTIRFTAKAKQSINHIKITLNGLDLYDVEYGRVHALKYTVKNNDENIYNDMLKGCLEEKLGLYLSL